MSDRHHEGLSELAAALPDEESVDEREEGAEHPAAERTAEPAADEAEVSAPEVSSRSSGVRRVLVPLVLLLLVASNATFAILLYRTAPDAEEAAVEEVAGRFAERLLSFDHRTLDADLARIDEDSTGEFSRQFEQVFGADIDVFREAIREAEASSAGSVHGVVAMSVEGDRATALVIADQTIRNRELPEGRTVLRVLDVALVKTAEGWKVDDVATMGGEG